MIEEAQETQQAKANPLVVLLEAKAAAYSLSIAGATHDIRYAATRTNDLLGRLVGHLERYRQIVEAPR